MKSRLNEFIKEFKSDPRNERLVSEARTGRLLSEKLRELREAASLTQAELAERLGRPQSFLAKLELGGYDRCNLSTLTTVARAIGFSIDFDRMFVALDDAIFSNEIECDFDSERERFEVAVARLLRAGPRVAPQYKKKQLAILGDDTPAKAEAVAA